MTYHRLLIAASLLLAAIGLRLYLPETAEQTLPAVQELIDEEDFVLRLPAEAAAWLDWR